MLCPSDELGLCSTWVSSSQSERDDAASDARMGHMQTINLKRGPPAFG